MSPLDRAGSRPIWLAMRGAGQSGAWRRNALFAVGCALILAAPLVGVLPGPGGTLVAAAGLSLVLRTSAWAKRLYVRFKSRFPKTGRMCDWGMRRPSHRRRTALARAREAPGG
ncbi:hypothetical protein [Sphingomonas jatrophae]|uniref:Transmembrane protein (PGPGW) n=1 Tax=Sphingomonas jatrophae TaxID=1166337 RepID=A0A1I6K7F0_9SPHN|nr:hypothetical protein [Sphingomonas jatrophae]SFR87163.1 hypothetical protein SAMN05192580_1411 [Sphingomonas jatrophae]